MRKLISILLLLCIALGMTACQQKTIVATINYKNGEKESGMSAELKENSTVKDLFDAFGKGEEFVYQVDSDGYIEAINGLGNNEDGYWEILLNGFTPDDVIAKTVLKDNDVVDVTYIPNTESAVTIVGGWETAEVAREELTDEEKEMFTTAVQDLLGETYEPVCVLATQLVSGTNYAYLARGTVVTDNPVSKFCIVKVYKDLEGNVKLEGIKDIDVTDIATRADTDEQIVGGWEVQGTGKPGSLGSEEAQASYDQAMADHTSLPYNPVQLLATQLVNGTNYVALVRGVPAGVEDTYELYIVRWYADLQGKSEITDIQKFDLNHYVD